MSSWTLRSVPFKYQLSDWTLFSVRLRLQVRNVGLLTERPVRGVPEPPRTELMAGAAGFLIRELPVEDDDLPTVKISGDYLCYFEKTYQRCFVDFGMSYEEYKNRFSPKTRSTMNRKIRKYAELCGGNVTWKTYRAPAEMSEFFHHARTVSRVSYQEKLLDAGLPDSEDFIKGAEDLARDDRLRAYILFHQNHPVAYLFCPEREGALVYDYLGYDPEYASFSAGTVLQWLVLEQLFQEKKFRYFDFTEGASKHKLFFSTHQQPSVKAYFIKNTLSKKMLVYSHAIMTDVSRMIGDCLTELGVKKRIKRLIRFST